MHRPVDRADAGAPAASAPDGRRPWRGRRVLLGVSGGIAAYKSVQIARDLTQLGAAVDVVLTNAAREFVGAVTFEALTGRRVYSDIFADGGALDHIRLARAADVICIAPSTADLIARAAAGQADDLLTAILLATRAPVLFCPAMNDRMWAHAQTQANVEHVRDRLGYRIVGPASGPLAFGEGAGPGRMEEPHVIIEHIGRALEAESALLGRTIVVTAGPTREAVDPVRVISNRSSGRMGYAIAAAAWRRGANVVLITGPGTVQPPVGPELVRVETAEQMLHAVEDAIIGADALVMAAAVSDFRPAAPAAGKIKKEQGTPILQLEPAPDVLRSTLPHRSSRLRVVGFALETEDTLRNAQRKLEEKGMDFVVLNNANEPGAGFDVETNRVTVISRDGSSETLPLQSKNEVADAILDRLAPLLPGA